MKQFKPIPAILFLLLVSTFSRGQTLDYTSVNYPTSICNVFNVSPPRVVGGLTHYPVSGGVSYNGSALVLQTKGGQTISTTLGTAYAIAIPIRQGYTYNITVNTNKVSQDPVSSPVLEIGAISSLPNPNTTFPAACGPLDQNKWSSLQPTRIGSSFINNGTPQNYPIVQNYTPSTNRSFLTILAHSGSLSHFTSVLINSITITETANISFNLTPAALSIACGSITPVTFTANNVNNIPNVTAYNWNLGAVPNGWMHNGSPAPQTISTGTVNSLTLTPVCGSIQKNISATVTVNGTNHSTNTCTVTSTAPTLSITGNNAFCSGTQTYSIANLPCNATVSWTSSNPTIMTVTPTGNPATVTRVGNGTAILTATIQNICGGAAITLQKSIKTESQPPVIGGTYRINGEDRPIRIWFGDPADDYNDACNLQNTFTNMQIFGANSATWSKIASSPSNISWSQTGNNINFYFWSIGQTAVFKIDATNSCGTATYNFGFKSIYCSPGGNPPSCNSYQVFPNPAKNTVNIIVPNIPPPCDNNFSDSKTATTQRVITEIKIYDNAGNLIRIQKVNKSKQEKIDLTGFRTGKYSIEISDGEYKERQSIIITK